MKKVIAGFITAVTLMSSGVTAYAQTENSDLVNKEQPGASSEFIVSLPQTSGRYEVGTTNFDWIDTSRKDEYTPAPDDYRELMVQAWYPMDPGTGEQKETYIPSPVQGLDSLTASFGMGKQFTGINAVDTDSYKDAQLSNSESKYPVVLFSHGLGRTRWEYQSITRELASHGYIVISIDHTHFSFGTEFEDGRFVPFSSLINPLDFDKRDEDINEIWVKDIQFAIQQLYALNESPNSLNFKDKIDMNKIAAIGHSFGGAAAARALQVEPRIVAAINMDGSFVGHTTATGNMRKPFAFIKTEAHAKDLRGEYVLPPLPPEMDPSLIVDLFNEYAARYEKAVEGDAYDITLEGTTHNEHMSFTDHPLLKSYYLEGTPYVVRDPDSDPNEFYRLVNNLILEFLDKYLHGKTTTIFDLTIVK
jgi:dienelactone hydrolase